jgi:hypothetical protein
VRQSYTVRTRDPAAPNPALISASENAITGVNGDLGTRHSRRSRTMTHRRPLALSLLVTIVLAIAVLIARDQLVTSGEADSAPAAVTTTATATEIPLVNLVRTADGQQVAVPAGSLDQQVYSDDDHDDDHGDYNDDHEDADDD